MGKHPGKAWWQSKHQVKEKLQENVSASIQDVKMISIHFPDLSALTSGSGPGNVTCKVTEEPPAFTYT